MSKTRRIRAKAKAISPIIATLILILITVVAGAIVYSFVGGYMSSLSSSKTAPPPNVQFVSANINSTNNGFNLTVFSPSSNISLVNNAYIYFTNGTLAATSSISPTTTSSNGATIITSVRDTFKVSDKVYKMSPDYSYYVTLLTTSGYQLQSPQFTG